mmetsp:Transcript_49534/g.150768  ORF Transcript_49534/g.150768 Transcript_49534/m.150768 type:complete len:204 (+) Transcript_49534:175-786(+)
MRAAGRTELWSPSTNSISLSPVYASNSFAVWAGLMKSSLRPCTKSAGMKLLPTCSSGFSSSMSNSQSDEIRRRARASAPESSHPGTGAIRYSDWASSSARVLKLQKGLSKTMPPIEWSLSACSSAVTAPMERPQRPTAETLPPRRRWSTHAARSSRSCQPSEIYSPSLIPHPAKSKANNEMPRGKNNGTKLRASSLQDAFWCR